MNFDIEAIKRKMLVKYPFFGSVVANVNYKANMNIPTAGTDGKVIHYNPEFLGKLSDSEQTFIFAHEVCHIAFNHILRSEGKDPTIWNVATDAVINAFLKRDGLKMVEGGVDMEDAINYDAEQLYEKLLQERQQQSQSGQDDSSQQDQQKAEQDSQSQSQNGQGQSQELENQNDQENTSGSGKTDDYNDEGQEKQQSQSGQDDSSQQEKKNDNSSDSDDSSSQEEEQDAGHDTHSMWSDAIKKHKEEEKNKNEEKKFNKDKQEKSQQENEIEKKQEEIEQLGEKESFKKNLEEKKKELEELKKALSQQTMGTNVGTSTNRDIRDITDIGRAKPLFDWRYILRETIKYDVDWSYRNAYIEDGVVTANLEEQPMPETEIVLDTSGSIDEALLKNFLRECKNILQYTKLKVGCFDTEFYGFHEIRTEEDIENMDFVGGGGTDFDVAVAAFSRRVENKIIFTDGEAYMPNKPLDAIWIVFGEIEINPRGGKVIQIDNEQLERLYSYPRYSSYRSKKR